MRWAGCCPPLTASALNICASPNWSVASDTKVMGVAAREVVLALPTTVDGHTPTVAERIGGRRGLLARGVPVGGELDRLDDGTIVQP